MNCWCKWNITYMILVIFWLVFKFQLCSTSASSTRATKFLFWGEAEGMWHWPPTPIWHEGWEWVDLYLHSHCVPSWYVMGWPLPSHVNVPHHVIADKKVEVKLSLCMPWKAHRRSGSAVPLILNLHTTRRWMVIFTPWPLYPGTHWREGHALTHSAIILFGNLKILVAMKYMKQSYIIHT